MINIEAYIELRIRAMQRISRSAENHLDREKANARIHELKLLRERICQLKNK